MKSIKSERKRFMMINMLLSLADDAWEDLYWQKINKANLRRINELIRVIKRTPFDGVGKPKPLKYDLAGYWSRRIDQKRRLVYEVTDEQNIIVQCRYHY